MAKGSVPDESELAALLKAGIRGLVSLDPRLSPLAQIWSEYETRQQSERFQDFFGLLRTELDRVATRVSDLESAIHDSQSVAPLLGRLVNYARREPSERKRRFLAKFFARALVMQTPTDRQGLADLLDSLTDADVAIFALFPPGVPRGVDDLMNSSSVPGGHDELRLAALVTSLAKLEARALVGETEPPEDDDGIFVHSGPRQFWSNRWRQKFFQTLPLGEVLYELLELHDV